MHIFSALHFCLVLIRDSGSSLQIGSRSSYLNDKHVDDPDVLHVGVLHELGLEGLLGVLLAEGQQVLAVHEGDLAPPRAVQAQHALAGLALVQRQQRLHLNEMKNEIGGALLMSNIQFRYFL